VVSLTGGVVVRGVGKKRGEIEKGEKRLRRVGDIERILILDRNTRMYHLNYQTG
jgi:hypothetical protein